MADLRQTAVSPHTMQGGQAQAPRGLAATALDPLRRAYQAYQQYVGQPFQQAVRGGVRGYFGLPMMSDADQTGREAYRQAEALGYTPGVGMPAGAVRVAAEGVQALPSIAGDIGRVIAGMPSGAGAAQAEDFARYQRSIPPSDVSPLTAFHGTPHRFEPTPANPLGEFRAAKIGSGEGAQAYGYGLYFAEAPGVAKSYISAGGARPWSPPDIYAADIVGMMGGESKALKYLKSVLPEPGQTTFNGESRELIESAIKSIEDKTYKQTGSLYTVDIPDSMIGKMLDWDKPLNKQDPKVQRALASAWAKEAGVSFDDAMEQLKSETQTAGSWYRNESFVRGGSAPGTIIESGVPRNPAAVSDFLRQAGIPGIRYLDAGSRGSADGTRNIVVFPGEESKVKILKRE